jgi:hypothetical protein
VVEAEEEATGRDQGQTENREEHESLRALLMTRNRSHARFRKGTLAPSAHSLTPTFLSRSHAHDLP